VHGCTAKKNQLGHELSNDRTNVKREGGNLTIAFGAQNPSSTKISIR
jgi:hypothetical protein